MFDKAATQKESVPVAGDVVGSDVAGQTELGVFVIVGLSVVGV